MNEVMSLYKLSLSKNVEHAQTTITLSGSVFQGKKRGKFPSFSIYSMEKVQKSVEKVHKSTQNPNYIIGEIYYIAHPMKSSRIAQSLLL